MKMEKKVWEFYEKITESRVVLIKKRTESRVVLIKKNRKSGSFDKKTRWNFEENNRKWENFDEKK